MLKIWNIKLLLSMESAVRSAGPYDDRPRGARNSVASFPWFWFIKIMSFYTMLIKLAEVHKLLLKLLRLIWFKNYIKSLFCIVAFKLIKCLY